LTILNYLMKKYFVFVLLALFCMSSGVVSQVLGPCGAPPQAEAEKSQQIAQGSHMDINPVPLPGQRALDFKLTAVVGDEIKPIKLSDYQGKWRVVCFFPAAFTFV